MSDNLSAEKPALTPSEKPVAAATTCSADDCEVDEDWDFEPCQTCGGDGIEDSDQLMEEDPLWWEGVDFIGCRNCRGSGDAKDQAYW